MAVGRVCVRARARVCACGLLKCERTGVDHIRTLTHNAVMKETICFESVASLLSNCTPPYFTVKINSQSFNSLPGGLHSLSFNTNR